MADELTDIQPIVLVGGRSARFGRDKLRELIGSTCLVDQSLAALRQVFGHRVAVVGQCHPAVASRGDLVIDDLHPGVGPIGGIVSALKASSSDVFVLAGDLPRITSDIVRHVLEHARNHRRALAVVARAERLQPCIGLYRSDSLPLLQQCIDRQAYRLRDALPADRVRCVDVDADAVVNINTPEAMARLQTGGAA